MRTGIAAAAALAALVWAAPAPAGVDLYEAACDGTLGIERAGTVRSPLLDEISGIVASRSRPRLLWALNDSGDAPRVYALTLAGRLVQTVEVGNARAIDWEDLARGPGPRPGVDLLYAADIGDNKGERRAITVYRFPEPRPGVAVVRARRITLRYPTGPRDAEALLVDPLRGTLVVLTKALGRSEIYTSPASGGTLRRIATLPLLAPVTAADVSAAGDLVVVRTYLSVLLWRRPPGTPLGAAFQGRPCEAPAPAERQGEAVAFTARATGLVTIGEGLRPAVNLIRAR